MTSATAFASDIAAAARRPKYSVVIPVFNGADVVTATVDGCVSFFQQGGLAYELVLVDDGSTDRTWDVFTRMAAERPNIVAVRLAKNVGQQIATLCGLRVSTGGYVITMDDDLQHAPSAIGQLIAKAHEGHDVVFARFPVKRQALWRRLPSQAVQRINRRVFGLPDGFVMSSFRLIQRRVVERMVERDMARPFVSGLAVRFASRPANALIEHRETARRRSTYSAFRLAGLAATMLIGHSAVPLRIVAAAGLVIALASLAAAVAVIAWSSAGIPDWAAVVIPLALMNGITIFLLGLLGEYLTRLMAQVTLPSPYEVAEVERSPAD
jgi:glycosyltransferase involved in cell wall biosynthesis